MFYLSVILYESLIIIVNIVMHFLSSKINLFKCCSDGKVRLPPPLLTFPEELHELLTSKTILLWVYINYAYSFVSLDANIHQSPGNGPPYFKICGQLFHRYGALLLDQNQIPSYSQLYIVEAANALNFRMANPVKFFRSST